MGSRVWVLGCGCGSDLGALVDPFQELADLVGVLRSHHDVDFGYSS